MFLLISGVAGFIFTFTLIVFYQKAIESDQKKRRLRALTATSKDDFDEDLEKPFVERFLIPLFQSVAKSLQKLTPKIPKSQKVKDSQKTEKLLKLAGLQLTLNEFNTIRLLIAFFASLLVTILCFIFRIDLASSFLIVLVSAVISSVVPTFYLSNLIKSRQVKIRNQLPEVMDLLSVSVEAGLGFDSALSKICDRLRGALVDELSIALIEIQLGKPRRDALKDLSERCPIEELKTFVSSIIQADQLGIPIKNVLTSQGHQLRVLRKQRAEERAMKAPVKMMIPLVVFILPVLFIILLGPAVIDVMNKF